MTDLPKDSTNLNEQRHRKMWGTIYTWLEATTDIIDQEIFEDMKERAYIALLEVGEKANSNFCFACDEDNRRKEKLTLWESLSYNPCGHCPVIEALGYCNDDDSSYADLFNSLDKTVKDSDILLIVNEIKNAEWKGE